MNPEPLDALRPFAVVVNDDPTQRTLLSGLVRKAGLEPRAFAGAEAALAAISANRDPGAWPILIVTDLYMPGIDGWRFCRLLRSPEYAAFNQVPILVVSATYSGDEASRIAADLGAEAFLPSPVDAQRFCEQVRMILSGEKVRPALRVLIVDDDPQICSLLKEIFAKHGYAAETALTIRDASEASKEAAYDVAVLDYCMPDGSGDMLLEEFHSRRPDCVCLMMTGAPCSELALNWMKRGAAAYLHKPFDPAYLIELCVRARRERALLRVQDLLELRTRELRRSEEKHRVLFENAGDAIFIHDSAALMLAVNPLACERLGYTRAELMVITIHQVDSPEQSLHAPDRIARLMEQGHLSFETVHRRKDGTLIPTEVSARRITWDGHPAMMSICRDITERKRMEADKAKLEAQNRQLQKAESLGRMAGSIAHHFNNQLGAVMMNLSMASGTLPQNQEPRGYVDQALEATRKAAEVSRLMLTYLGQTPGQREPLDLSEACRQSLPLLQAGMPRGLTLETDLPSPGPWVSANRNQIQQLLANLVTNAWEASGPGPSAIRLSVKTVSTEDIPATHRFPVDWHPQHPAYACLEVADAGCGIPNRDIEKLFDPFFSTKFTGRGLGLAVVLGIVRAHGGAITVWSKPGLESVFRVFLPVGSEALPQNPTPAVQAHQTAGVRA
jgi:PAS domain S-box-containing protein